MSLHFSLVDKSDESKQRLFELLTARVHKISHGGLPSFEEHAEFVQKHPYRAWYFVFSENDGKKRCIGHVYLKFDNSLGINLLDNEVSKNHVFSVIQYIKKNYEPMPPIKSMVSARFHVNVAESNVNLQETLNSLGGKVAQVTYFVDKL